MPPSDPSNETENEGLEVSTKRPEDGPAELPSRSATQQPDASLTQAEQPKGQDHQLAPIPTQIDRYRVIRLLGTGGYGAVYLATDDTLRRDVTIKVPHRQAVRSDAHVKKYMDEAMMVAQLEHPHIVPVYDVGRLPDGMCFIVSKYVESETLADRLPQGIQPSHALEIIIDLAETLQHVHDRGIVHRDIKPSNVLISRDGNYFINDFGLAMIEVTPSESGRLIGTPAYMSPEQASGEGHLVDGRSDVFALGVMLYEMLVGRRPFRGGTTHQLVHQIRTLEPRPLRQLNRDLPVALERVCQKSLAKSVVRRYQSAMEFAEDLRHVRHQWDSLQTANPSAGKDGRQSFAVFEKPSEKTDSTKGSDSDGDSESDSGREENRIMVVPKGLRSYGQEDAEFFQAMLPGPYDLDGCPESIRFWVNRIDPPLSQSDSQGTQGTRRGRSSDPFRVGVIYGTSGCGKSSFIHAGLIPTLNLSVHVCAVDATERATLRRIDAALSRIQSSPTDSDMDTAEEELKLDERMATIRRGEGIPENDKVLLVIDQFEQWLNVADPDEWSAMVRALRQCDGHRLQTILLVRDDFWLATSRLMRELDIELSASHNLAMVDLLDRSHAERLLEILGRGYGCVGQNNRRPKREERLFIQEAVQGISTGNRVVAVQLALFAELMKSRPWTRSTLKDLSGIDRIVEQFLHESFDAVDAPRNQKQHSVAAHAALSAMLPESGSIRGASIDSRDLARAAGYELSSESMADLLRVLDHQLKLITPVLVDDSIQNVMDESGGIDSAERRLSRYQLTHDSLVPAIRRWVDAHDNATPAGRAKLQLKARSQSWINEKDSRQLPSMVEWLRFWALVPRRQRNETENQLMATASRRHGRSLVMVGALVLFMTWAWNRWQDELHADRLVAQLSVATTSQLPATLEEIDKNPRIVTQKLRSVLDSKDSHPRARFLAALALPPNEPVSDEVIGSTLLNGQLDLLRLVRERRPRWSLRFESLFSEVLADAEASNASRLRAGLFLIGSQDRARANPSQEKQPVSAAIREHVDFLAESIIDESLTNRLAYGDLIQLVLPARETLNDALTRVTWQSEGDVQRDAAFTIIRDLHAPDVLAVVAAAIYLPTDVFNVVTRDLDWTAIPLDEFDAVMKRTREPSFEIEHGAAIRFGRESALRVVVAYHQLSERREVQSVLAGTLRDLVTRRSDSIALASFADVLVDSPLDNEAYLDDNWDSDEQLQRYQLFLLGQKIPNLSEDETRTWADRIPQDISLFERRVHDLARHRFETSDDPGVFAASRWLLSRLGDAGWVRQTLRNQPPGFQTDRQTEPFDPTVEGGIVSVQKETNSDHAANRNKQPQMRINSQGIPMIRFPANTIAARSLPFDEGHVAASELPLEYDLEVSSNEITVWDYLHYFPEYEYNNRSELESTHIAIPAGVIPWEEAVKYCQWLSEQDGMSDKQKAYELVPDPIDQKTNIYVLKEGFQNLAGYRLPTAREWTAIWDADPQRVACVMDDGLVRHFANIQPFSQGRPEPIGGSRPDRHGLFHLAGNAEEWCSDQLFNNRSVRGIFYGWGLDERFKITEVRWANALLNWKRYGFRVVRSIPTDSILVE